MQSDPRNPNLQTGVTYYGYTLEDVRFIDHLQIHLYEFSHKVTGARHIHISSPDDNNVGIIAFRTIPRDSTGCPHILEHAVLEGSKKYPVKSYKHLSGRSLNTFLNAATAPDCTEYLFASRNPVDFFNLLDIYMDAVFFPLLTRESFCQEGWRLEFDQPDNPNSRLLFKGVVYNEMKGDTSDMLARFYRLAMKEVFPNTPYRFDSGGVPREIPNLSYEDWLRFHRENYHPSNAYFYTYGTLPALEILREIDSTYLRRFTFREVPEPVSVQPLFKSPRNCTHTVPVAAGDSHTQPMAAVLWKLAPVKNVYKNLKLKLLSKILLGDSSSPLSQIILESGLGNGILPLGHMDFLSESVFAVGMKEISNDAAVELEELVLSSLEAFATKGINPDDTAAALHQLELESLEITGEMDEPYGMSLAFGAMNVWMQGGRFQDAVLLNGFFKRLANETRDPACLSQLIRTSFLDNPHRVRLILTPDRGGLEKLDEEIKHKLDSIRVGLSPEDVREIIDQAMILKDSQDLDEDLSCMPQIQKKDINEEPDHVPEKRFSAGDIPLYCRLLPTNTIQYVNTVFLIDPRQFFPGPAHTMIPLLPELGTLERSFADMGRQLRMYTGGMNVRLETIRNLASGFTQPLFSASSYCLPENFEKLLELTGEVILKPRLTDLDRTRPLVGMRRAYAEIAVNRNAVSMAMTAASRHISKSKYWDHHIKGLGFVQTITRMNSNNLQQDLDDLRIFMNACVRKENMVLGMTTPQTCSREAVQALGRYADAFSTRFLERIPVRQQADEEVQSSGEAWTVNMEVSNTACVYPVVTYEHVMAPVLTVLARLMEIPLHNRIREQGGAYGSYAGYNAMDGTFSLVSYMDPHTANTLKNFDAVLTDLGEGNFSDEQIDQAIVETIRQIDLPEYPEERGYHAFIRALTGQTPELRKAYRMGILNTSRSDIIKALETYLSCPDQRFVVIVTSDEILNNAETASLNLTRIPVFEQA